MAKQYWVGEYFVDLSRNQISQHYQSQTLPPKALLVLTHLAENRGKVVSYDELLDAVWPSSVVTPNTLQRSIAQLRKALGEDSKAQGIIKTHAKQGYSLECEVSWSDDGQPATTQETQAQIDKNVTEDTSDKDEAPSGGHGSGTSDVQYLSQTRPQDSQKFKVINKHYWLVIALASLFLIIFLMQFLKHEPQLQLGEFRYITATDDKEFGAIYSSDGQYILFRRYYDQACVNNIWAKHADSLEEFQLTEEKGTYGSHSLSTDGKTLVFIKQQDCTKPVLQNTCYKLMSMDFSKALSQPQRPNELLECQYSAIKRPLWVGGSHIVMMQREDQSWRLIRYSMQENSSSTLYEIEGGNIIHFALSFDHKRLAVTSIKNDGLQYIDILTPDGDVVSSHQIQFPPDIPRHLSVIPQFMPDNEQLIFGDGSNIYTLSFEGDVKVASFQMDEDVGGPSFHPSGKRMMLIKGRYDSDVATLMIPEENVDEQGINLVVPTVFERSINHEDNPKYQPNGDLIAFVSKRTGIEQVWLSEDGSARVISNFPKGAFIDDLHWSDDGNSLLMLVDMELHKVLLNKEITLIPYQYPVTELFHWNSQQHRAIANIKVNGMRKFVSINLITMEYETINAKTVRWAVKDQNEGLILLDSRNRFWRQGTIEDKLIEPLTEQGSGKRFVVDNGRVYGINKQDQLWSYDLQTGDFNLIAEVPEHVDYLTDVRNKTLLLSVVIAAKKEVIEVTIAE